AALVLTGGHDHVAHDRQSLVGHEHVLGAAEADALGPELTRLRCVFGRVGVRAYLQTTMLVGPAEDHLEVLVDLRRYQLDCTDDNDAAPAVDRDRVALRELVRADPNPAPLA